MRRIGAVDGDKRYVKRFLFLPYQFGRDWRWLEWAEVEEEYCFWPGWITIGFKS